MRMCCGAGEKRFDGAAHGQKAGPVDIDAVDLLDLGESDRPRHSAPLDLDCELVPGPRIELLRIVDSWNPRPWLKYDRRGRHRPRERTHAGFIDAGDVQHAGGPKRVLELQQLAQSLPLRAVSGAPPRDGVQNCLCAGARISPQRGFCLRIEPSGLDDVIATDLSKHEACHGDNLAGIASETIGKPGWSELNSKRGRLRRQNVVIGGLDAAARFLYSRDVFEFEATHRGEAYRNFGAGGRADIRSASVLLALTRRPLRGPFLLPRIQN